MPKDRSISQQMTLRTVVTVRTMNKRAIRFYQKVGMKKVGSITQSKGTVTGDVYLRAKLVTVPFQ